MKRLSGFFFQVILPTVILTFLFRQMSANNLYADFQKTPKHLTPIVLGFVVYLAAILVTFVRWHLLNRIQDFPVSVWDSIRMAFYGFLCRLVPVGGYLTGDVARVWLLVRKKPGKEPEAIASIAADRVMSLYSLALTGFLAAVFTGIYGWNAPFVKRMVELTAVVLVISTLCFALLLGPDHSRNRLLTLWEKIPKIGGKLRDTGLAICRFRGHLRKLLLALSLSVIADILFGVMIYLIATGLLPERPGFGPHLFITQIGFSSGMIPIVIGPFELVFRQFYLEAVQTFPFSINPEAGVLIVFVYRLYPPLLTVLGLILFGKNMKAFFKLDKTRHIEPNAGEPEPTPAIDSTPDQPLPPEPPQD